MRSQLCSLNLRDYKHIGNPENNRERETWVALRLASKINKG